MLVGLGIPYAIIRPTLVFGVGDLLLNNMAWALRRFPVFPVYGNGDYPVQPVYVEDLASQAVEAGSQSESSVADAAGPDTFSFEALFRLLASSMGVRRWFLHTPPRVGLALTGLVGLLMRDMALTHDEVDGLMAGLLTSEAAPTGRTRLSDWLAETGTASGDGTCPSCGGTTEGSGHRDGAGKDGCASMGGIAAAHPVLSQSWGGGPWGSLTVPLSHISKMVPPT